jgi:hypothetical protein
MLIFKGQLSKEDIKAALPDIQKAYQKHLEGICLAISELPD